MQMAADLGPGGVRALAALGPFATLWDSLGRHFHDPRLRQLFAPLRHLLRRLAVGGAGDADAGRARRDGRRLVDRRRHGTRWRGAWPSWPARAARACAWAAASTRIEVARGRVAAVHTAVGERIDADSVVFNGDADALARGLLGRRGAHRHARCRRSERSLSAVTWAMHVRSQGFALARHNVFFDDDYASEFDDVFRRRRLPQRGTVYLCAQDRLHDGVPPTASADGRERLLALVNAPADGDHEPLRRIGDRAMRTTQPGPAAALRPAAADRAAAAGGAAHAERLRAPVPGLGRGAVRPGDARLDGAVQPPGHDDADRGPVPGGGQCAPGTGRADGGDERALGSRDADGAPRFDRPLAPGAYRWWYVDAVSDDGRHALTLIAFVGSVFSPYYRRARQHRGGSVDAQDHCAINVCVYSPGAARWAMTERGRSQLQRSAHEFALGPSRLAWNGSTLVADIDERGAPLPRRVRGRLVVQPLGLSRFAAALDAAGRHRWGPIAPCARIEVDLPQPGVRWRGHAYVDSNEGDEPIEDGFVRWDWLRAALPDGRCAVLYDAQPRHGAPTVIGACLASDGSVEPIVPGPRQRLAPTRWWRIDRRLAVPGCGDGAGAQVERTLEDTPFYARSLLRLPWDGTTVTAVHETLDVRRLVTPAVQAMLPFRMPRRA